MHMVYTLLIHVHPCMYQVLQFYSSTRLLMQLKLVNICINCLTLLIPVMRLWRYSFSAWIGIQCLANQAFQSQSCLNCSRKRSILLTSCRKTSLIRQAKRPSGILKRHIAFCTRSAKLRCGETQITPCVRHQRYAQTCMYTYVHGIYYVYACSLSAHTGLYRVHCLY
jgi:hypothetical protein